METMSKIADISRKQEGQPPSFLIARALDILKLNQNLIQFADTKANTLIVINSIFLASLSAIPAGQVPGVLKTLFFISSVASIIYCLLVVIARRDDPDVARNDLIFFGDIIKYRNAREYLGEFTNLGERQFLEDLGRRIYCAAGIAANKFKLYATAQNITFASCLLWIACMLSSFIAR